MCGGGGSPPEPKKTKLPPREPIAAPQKAVDPAQLERARKSRRQRYADSGSSRSTGGSAFMSNAPSLIDID